MRIKGPPREVPHHSPHKKGLFDIAWDMWFESLYQALKALGLTSGTLDTSKDVQTDSEGALTTITNTGTVNNVMSTDPTFDNDIYVTTDIEQAPNDTDGNTTTLGYIHRKPKRLRTTTATTSTLDSFTMTADYGYIVTFRVVANDDTGIEAPSIWEGRYKFGKGGASSYSTIEQELDFHVSVSGLDVLMDRSGDDARLRVTSVADNIHWVGQISHLSVNGFQGGTPP